MSNIPTFTEGLIFQITQFIDSDALALKTILPTTSNGVRITGIDLSNSDSDLEFELYVNDGSTDYLFWTGEVPADSGNNDGIPLLSCLQLNSFTAKSLDANSNAFLDLPATHSLKLKMNNAVSASESVNVFVRGELF